MNFKTIFKTGFVILIALLTLLRQYHMKKRDYFKAFKECFAAVDIAEAFAIELR